VALKSIACARVSSHDQKADRKHQQQVLELYRASQVEIITEFSARLYRSRSHKNQKLIVGVCLAVKEAQ
jgi:predicted site-specific integrase-resolvase